MSDHASTVEFVIEDGVLQEYNGISNCVKVPEGVAYIDEDAFVNYKESLEQIEFPKTLQAIGERVFAACTKLKEVVIPANVTEIREEAFFECKLLRSVHFENVENVKIGPGAFDDTLWVENAIKADGVLIVGNYLIKAAPNLMEYTVPDGIACICGGAFQNSRIERVILPDTVTCIGESAFGGSCLKHIQLPQDLIRIEDGAFADCEALEELTIPASVAHIGILAFHNIPNCVITFCSDAEDFPEYEWIFGFMILYDPNCINAKEVRAPYGSAAMRYARLWSIPYTALPGLPKEYIYIADDFCCKGTVLHKYLGHSRSVHVPEGITEIEYGAFYQCVEHVYLPESVKRIRSSAFNCVKALRTVEGPSVKQIDSNAFLICDHLEKAVFPQLECYAENAFEGCELLTKKNILIPQSAVILENTL